MKALMRRTHYLELEAQKAAIEPDGHTPIQSSSETDSVKKRVAVEVQFDEYAFVAHDQFVKQLSLFMSDVIDVGIEILPIKELEQHLSSGVPHYEHELVNVIRQGRGVSAAPKFLFGVSP